MKKLKRQQKEIKKNISLDAILYSAKESKRKRVRERESITLKTRKLK